MTDSSVETLPPPSLTLKDVFRFLARPAPALERLMAIEAGALWRWPMLVVSLTLLLRLVVTGAVRARLAAMGQPPLPPDWEWWTPEMQENYMQALQVTQGAAFLYVIPSILGMTGLWLRWLIVAGVLHLVSTLFGGRGNMRSALALMAWSLLPFALRDLLQAGYMLLARHTIVSPGLSGFVLPSSSGALFLAQMLKQTDLFLFWYLALLALGLQRLDGLSRGKAWLAVALAALLVLAATAGLGAIGARLSGMVIFRPF